MRVRDLGQTTTTTTTTSDSDGDGGRQQQHQNQKNTRSRRGRGREGAMVPSTWTTCSGNFHPTETGFGFDEAFSTVGRQFGRGGGGGGRGTVVQLQS